MALPSHSNLDWLQRFYASMCNGDWEHGYGFSIENVDNPGWSFKFELSDTFLEGQPYEAETLERSDTDWVLTKVEENRWIGYGGALNLDDIIGLFRKWAEGELA
ncbi:MAG: immunity 53 family protein [Pseudomonadota bacterium]